MSRPVLDAHAVVRRAAFVSASVASGAVVAGAVGSALIRRSRVTPGPPVGDLPPEALPDLTSFDGTRLAMRGAGRTDAPTIVLCHGFSLDMSTWSEQWPELARDFRVVAFDHRSHGRSSRAARRDLTTDAMGRDVMAVVDTVSPHRRVVLVGHDIGASAILAAAGRDPDLFAARVVGVVLVGAAMSGLLLGTTGHVPELVRPRPRALARAARTIDGLRRTVLSAPGDIGTAFAWLSQFGPGAPIDIVDHVVSLARSSRREVWADGLRELIQTDLDWAPAAVAVPALVIVGELDRVAPPAAAVALAGALPLGRLAVVAGAGHIAMLERPDATNREIRAFLRRVAAPRAERLGDAAGRPERPAPTATEKARREEGAA
jgi:pimeloyl-ACP methyl ester carboxylesterase